MIEFKTPNLPEELRKCDFYLLTIFFFIVAVVWLFTRERVKVTCVYRQDGGIHQYYRAIDFGMLTTVSEQVQENFRRFINLLFPYGDSKHETVPKFNHAGNATVSTAKHWHLQVKYRG